MTTIEESPDRAAIAEYLALTVELESELAHLAAALAPKPTGKFDARELVTKAIEIKTEVRNRLHEARRAIVSNLGQASMLLLHHTLHGESDHDYGAYGDPDRLHDPLAGPVASKWSEIEEMFENMEPVNLVEREKWRVKFAPVAKGAPWIPLEQAARIVLPRAKHREDYLELYRERMKPDDTQMSLHAFPNFAATIRFIYEQNKEAVIKRHRRSGGSKGGKKSAARRRAAEAREAAKNLDPFPTGDGTGGQVKNRPNSA